MRYQKREHFAVIWTEKQLCAAMMLSVQITVYEKQYFFSKKKYNMIVFLYVGVHKFLIDLHNINTEI